MTDIRNNLNRFTDKPDVFILTETWLNTDTNSSELGLNDYDIFRSDKLTKNDHGGGVIIAAKKYLHATLCDLNNKNISTNFQSLFIKIQFQNIKWIFGGSYFPPNSPAEY